VAASHRKGRRDATTPILVNALKDALKDHGGIFRPRGELAAVHAVPQSEVWRLFADRYPAGEDTKDKSANATRLAFRRALLAAHGKTIGKGTNAEGQDMLWFLPGHSGAQ
jgi:hypothetical protein